MRNVLSLQSELQKLNTGFDYYDKTINLRPLLGQDFFPEPMRADGISQIALLRVTHTTEGWNLIIAGDQQLVMQLRLSDEFNVRGASIVK